MPLTRRLVTSGLAAMLLAGVLGVPAVAAPAPVAAAAAGVAAVAATATTGAAEKRRVDRVPTPKLKWFNCYGWAQCATAKVPLDYDRPYGAQTTLALLRVKAKNQKAKIGSLFVNPGGPGAPATDLALAAPFFLSDSLLERFDVVGVDPRGIGFSDTVHCFGSVRSQTLALKGMQAAFPYGAAQEKAYLSSAGKLAKGCSTTGRPLAGSMSTTEVARDMDVMRRAVGDRKLTYLGFSYGSALGQYYANMFPDRFRALAVDGVINPVSWAGTPATKNVVQDDRLHSADGAYQALREILIRCNAAGPRYCPFSAGRPLQNFATIAARLKKKPVVIDTLTITYSDFIGLVFGSLYGTTAGDDVTAIAAAMMTLTSPASAVPATELAAARTTYLRRRSVQARDFTYDNSIEAFAGVMCTDGLHPASMASWPKRADAADRRAPYFGRLWAWASVPCARTSWTVRDEDAWTGPFNRRTAKTVLVVGSRWDPATNYTEAVSSAKLLPNSRLLSSTNWGHTAYGTSPCVTTAIDAYLLRGTVPPTGTVCAGAPQPFTTPLDEPFAEKMSASRAPSVAPSTKAAIAAQGLPAAGAPKQLPPVTRRIPGLG